MSFVDVLPVEPVIADDARAASLADGAARARASAANASSGTSVAAAPRARASRDEVAPAADGDEEIARPDAARVDLDTGDPVAAASSAPAGSRELVERRAGSRGARAAAQRLARDLAVVERQLDARDLLALLVALAGDHDDVARRARSPIARSIARAPVELDLERARSAPARISSMIARGSSLRGLSDVTIARSASSAATAPISGRLPRSRSPPQPKTQISRPSASSRAARSTFSSESGVCA